MIKTYIIARITNHGAIPLIGCPLMTRDQAEHYAYQMQLGGKNVTAFNPYSE
jgi:hypothetical protein